ncbi:polyprenyl synthetase family protein [Pseudoroseicyclus aestuarii]|uniref:Geranylgeranyl diphosphate synthase n=1 Tax=Pseudoroseicyclus aestuarii TaxID=1795041 RepID=A0A318SXH5_9RHOB|nr:polyprenyl synthetase family protein [Pseudoroseicyclus aestuarii]PYE84527.1 farnesyl-diphosphate synthase [Pseudoroseicyclus aestuarii]
MSALDDGLARARAIAEEALPERGERLGPLAAPMGYAIEGGKALRGFLVLEGARLHGLDEGAVRGAVQAAECLHAYSLVHDDLPSMDDDDLRRGRPTLHRQWDEATAILAGDGLQALSFELLAGLDLPPSRVVALIRGFASAVGAEGMVLGQAMDIAAETAEAPLTLEEITDLQAKKTGALIRWSAGAGAVMAGADDGPLDTYGRALGMAFQIADDLLDVTGDAGTVGKATGKDADAGKATFVSLLGLKAAQARASALVEEACDALSPYGPDAETLRDAARFVISRKR